MSENTPPDAIPEPPKFFYSPEEVQDLFAQLKVIAESSSEMVGWGEDDVIHLAASIVKILLPMNVASDIQALVSRAWAITDAFEAERRARFPDDVEPV